MCFRGVFMRSSKSDIDKKTEEWIEELRKMPREERIEAIRKVMQEILAVKSEPKDQKKP
jgi:hypothetical protein